MAPKTKKISRFIDRTPIGAIVIAGAVAAVAILGLALFQFIRYQESEAIAGSASTNVNLAHTFNGHVLGVVSNVDLHSKILAEEIARHGAGRVDLDAYRRKIEEAMPYVPQIGIIDASGHLAQASPPHERLYLGDDESFRAHLNADTGKLHIAKPTLGRVTRKWWIEMSRRLTTPGGAFAGVLVFLVDAEYFSRFFAAVPVGRNGVVEIVRSDGIITAVRNGQNLTIGTDIGGSPAFKTMAGRKAGFFISTGSLDGTRRILAFDTLNSYPLTVIVGTSVDEVLAPLRSRRPAYYASAGAVSLLLLAGSLLVAWLVGKQKRTNAELAASQGNAQALLNENRRAILDLQVAEERWKFALEGARDGVWDWNAQTDRAYFSRRWKEMLGHAEEEIGNDPDEWQRRVHPEDRAQTLAKIQAHLDGETPGYASEHRMLCKDGSWIWILDRGMVVSRDAEGRPLRMIGTHADITELKYAASELRTLSRVVEQSPASIVITDKAGNIEYVNPRFEEVTGYSMNEVLGRNPRILKSGRTSPAVYEHLWQTITKGGTWHGELCNRNRNGEDFWESASISGLVDEQGRIVHFAAVKVDITESKQMEAEIRALNESLERRVAERTAELERANRELNAFTYSISHDLRAPVRSLNGFSSMLKESEAGGLSPHGQELLGRILRNSRRMGDMIDDLLRLSRIGRGGLTVQRVDLDELVADIVADIAESYSRTEVALKRLHAAACDRGLVRQVFENLIGNAFKFSANGDAPRVEVGAKTADGEKVFYVRDNGVGFDMRYADRLFGVFQRLHNESEFPGTGVGLAIVKRIVERHGGRIWPETTPNGPTTFYFTLGKPS